MPYTPGVLKRLAVSLLIAGGGLCIARADPPVLTLQQCIDSALSRGDDIRILQDTLAAGREQYAQAVSRNSMTLTGSAGYGYATDVLGDRILQPLLPTVPTTAAQAGLTLGGPLTSAGVTASTNIPPEAGTDAGSLLGVTFSQVLWNGYPGGPAQAAVDKGLLAFQGMQLTADAGQQSLVYRVKEAYYTMLGAQRTLSVKGQILDKQKLFLAQMQAIYDMQQASKADLQTAQINVQSAVIDLKSGEHDVRLARIRLSALIGEPSDLLFSVAEADDPQMPEPTLAQAIADGLGRRTEIKQVDLSRRSNAVDLALAQGQATPSVSVSGGINWLVDWTGIKGAGIINAGVTVGLPILDAGLVMHLQQEKMLQDNVFAVQESQLRKSIAADIQDAFESVDLARERLELARLTAENMDLLLELTRTQRDFGTMTNQDFLTAAVNAANAQTALAAARSNAQLAVLTLQNAMGY